MIILSSKALFSTGLVSLFFSLPRTLPLILHIPWFAYTGLSYPLEKKEEKINREITVKHHIFLTGFQHGQTDRPAIRRGWISVIASQFWQFLSSSEEMFSKSSALFAKCYRVTIPIHFRENSWRKLHGSLKRPVLRTTEAAKLAAMVVGA